MRQLIGATRKPLPILQTLMALACIASLSSCRKPQEPPKLPPPLVVTAEAVSKDVPFSLDSFGSITPVNNVDIKPQVTGKLMEAKFVDGQHVKSGDLLFIIDKSPFDANLKNAKGTLQEDKASYKYAKYLVDSNKNLADKSIVPAQQFEQYVSNAQMYEGKILSDEAQVDTASINLGYCEIRSPVDGITGRRLVDPGNIATANDGASLVNIKTLSPIYADFTLPEKHFSTVKDAMAKGELKVEVIPTGSPASRPPSVGTLTFIDNTVDTSTGTISLRATLPNSDGSLWPGQFITVKLILHIVKDAVVVPSGAVQSGKSGRYVYVVRNGKVAFETVELGPCNEKFSSIVNSAVKPGEKVVTVGGMMLKPDAPVREMAQGGTPPAGQQKPETEHSDKTQDKKP